ncbi:protein ABHD1 [Alligator mississippiensis]|uniref:protein ABHD1 n=1 Tax=Alligator mississippiensis TaxID=8496 RepID=UPI002877BC94|nr:protein ABHD1 [Alligator mississippiensis]
MLAVLLLLPGGTWPWVWALTLGAGIAWLGYYWMHIAKRPLLVAAPPLRAFLEQHCPIVCETFYPTPWCFEGRLQTLLRYFGQTRPRVSYRSELLRTADGGQLVLDWADNAGSQQYPDPGTRPTLLLLPGTMDNSEASYILHMVHAALQAGYRCAVLNYRGCKGDELLTPKAFSPTSTEDLETTIAHLWVQLPQAPLLAVGVSLGGMLVLHYLARTGYAAGLEAAVVFSAPWDYEETLRSLEQPINAVVIHGPFMVFLRQLVHRHRQAIAAMLDVDHILKARTLREFDERYTAPVFGYESCKEYVQAASPAHSLPAIRVPLLCLTAADDLFSPLHAIPMEMLRHLPHTALLVTARGGHIGFQEGLLPWRHNYPARLCIQFTTAVLEQGTELHGLVGNPGTGTGARAEQLEATE